jgi:hypothetical protein
MICLHVISPATPRELYNLRHAVGRNVVERIFGVLKRRFRYVFLVIVQQTACI